MAARPRCPEVGLDAVSGRRGDEEGLRRRKAYLGVVPQAVPRVQNPSSFRLGRCEVHPLERRLLVDGVPAQVGARAFDLLLALIEKRGQVLTKSQLLDEVWPGLVV